MAIFWLAQGVCTSLMINKPTDVKGWQPFGTMGKDMFPYKANYFNNAGGRPNLSMGMMTIVSLIMQILKQVATQADQPTMGHQGPDYGERECQWYNHTE